ncbi:helix-turn-helix domain-containing protein [Hymenobacter sp.]|uniref:GlxA family transcriptional regulator n=1 Tax=Hymenobacter sp. TaxID=1898978 RepID=UPI00286B4A7E|nr:helix-turn-helix domain-containing protein [Hymenobacter sp.]
MKHVSILVPAGDVVVGSIEGPYKVFRQVNEMLTGMGLPAAFAVELVGPNRSAVFNDGVFTLRTDRTMAEDFRTDLIIIPAPHGDLRQAVALNADLVAWIRQQYHGGAEVASLCMGAFLLAATGLIDGRRCATHWLAANEFRAQFPAVELLADKIITDEQGIYSSGGAYSYLNLILYLVEKQVSREVALFCAKVFQIDISRSSQSPFTIFLGQKEHADEPILKVQKYIEANYPRKLTVEELAAMSFLGRRHFERRFKKATFNSVLEYIQRVRIEAAKAGLEKAGENVSEVMYAVGYSDTKAFRMVFKNITGLSPAEYRNRYHKVPMAA